MLDPDFGSTMKRYFLVLSSMAAVMLVAAFILGIGFLFERSAGVAAPRLDQPLRPNAFTAHMAVSLTAALFTLFVHCLVFTYLLGTGKWVKEVSAAYGFPVSGWPEQTKQFKIQVNRIMLLAMGLIILAAVTGAGAQVEPGSWWSLAHPVLAVLVMFVNGWTFWVEYRVILANEVVLVQVKAAADEALAAQGIVGEPA
jgi:hypothetical protein